MLLDWMELSFLIRYLFEHLLPFITATITFLCLQTVALKLKVLKNDHGHQFFIIVVTFEKWMYETHQTFRLILW